MIFLTYATVDLTPFIEFWAKIFNSWWFPLIFAFICAKFYIYIRDFNDHPYVVILNAKTGKYENLGRYIEEDTIGNKFRLRFNGDHGVKEIYSYHSFTTLKSTPNDYYFLRLILPFVSLHKITERENLKITDREPKRDAKFYLSVIPFYLCKILLFPQWATKIWKDLNFHEVEVQRIPMLDVIESLYRAEVILNVRYDEHKINHIGNYDWMSVEKKISGSELIIIHKNPSHYKNLKILGLENIESQKISPAEVMISVKSKLDSQSDHLIEKMILQYEIDEKDRRYTEIVNQLHKTKQDERNKRDQLLKDLSEQDILNDNTLVGMLKKIKSIGYLTDDTEEIITRLVTDHLDSENKELKELREENQSLKGQIGTLEKITGRVISDLNSSKLIRVGDENKQ
jgi:hypothetical protein